MTIAILKLYRFVTLLLHEKKPKKDNGYARWIYFFLINYIFSGIKSSAKMGIKIHPAINLSVAITLPKTIIILLKSRVKEK